jgi:hypothetical protein
VEWWRAPIYHREERSEVAIPWPTRPVMEIATHALGLDPRVTALLAIDT